MGYLPPTIPEDDGSDILVMLKRLQHQKMMFLLVCVAGGFGIGFFTALIVWAM